MKATARLADPVVCGNRTIVPVIHETIVVSGHGGFVTRDPIGLVFLEDKEAWFVSLAEGVGISIIDEILGIKE